METNELTSRLEAMISEFVAIKSQVPNIGGARQLVGSIEDSAQTLLKMLRNEGTKPAAIVEQTRVVEDGLFKAEDLLDKASRFGAPTDIIEDKITSAKNLLIEIQNDSKGT